MAPPTRFERVTSPLGGVRSILLSYGGSEAGVPEYSLLNDRRELYGLFP